MPTEATFRFSTYLTLALACAAVGYAQAPMLPEAAVFAGLAVGTLVALYFVESRYALLSIPAANRLGGIVGAAFLAWVGYRVKREIDTGEFAHLGWPMLFVAMCGPLVLMLLAAKAARGEKHAGDYWTLHGTALAGIGLAAAFADEALCFVLLGLYLVAAVWSLTLFHLARSAGHVRPVPSPDAPAPRTAAASGDPHGSRTGFRSALLSAAVAGAVALPLYLLTPRSTAAKAEFGTASAEIGYSADQMVDLKTTGTLKPSNETAFEVVATYPDGTPKNDIRPDQRWRGRTHHQYSGGAWNRDAAVLPTIAPRAKVPLREAGDWTPPDLGPGQYRLEYALPPRPEAHFVADPVLWIPDEPPPLAGYNEDRPQPWTPGYDGTFFWEPIQSLRRRPLRYVQAYAPRSDPDLGPGFQLESHLYNDARDQLRVNPLERVKEYTDALIARMVADGTLPAGWRDAQVFLNRRTLLPREEYHERLARALCAHLATNPEFRYTLELKREQPKLDPVEEFLLHSKSGHCQRFATALVLMLRSQGIPAVYVRGFKGCEHLGDGRYAVKQEQAHAWAEALVEVVDGSVRRFHWLSLDPTPDGSVAGSEVGAPWWRATNNQIGAWFRHHVVNYTAEQRRKDLTTLAETATRPEFLVGSVIIAVLVLGATVAYRRARRPAPLRELDGRVRWFGELVAVLSAHGFVPERGETLLEYATRAAAGVGSRPGCVAVAHIPVTWAESYYQERFGNVPPSDARRTERAAELESLRRALESYRT
ncbi:transglutaminaseTgpA domain-containing protein [Gemmata sp. JC673]|uniref:TransglutaminaseTgpA domain-containing protein n=1 Tax=Gemmata algarum TaxID=2975278 RepID=A0ABU5F138_9BACT|nr:transglutaminaseTgpA domain-containing protein [Gemmata algarum]MDY3559574.1 transglutaminaseTgpA domain-containing protein [Gemmata algarum]